MAKQFDKMGREIPDPTPLEIPAGMTRPESLIETMRRLIRVEVSQRAEAAGLESFDEAFDFDMDDDAFELAETPHTLLGSEDDGIGYEERLGAEGGVQREAGPVRAEPEDSGKERDSEEESGDGGEPGVEGGRTAGPGGDLPGKPGGGARARAPSKPGVKGKGAKRPAGKPAGVRGD